MAFHMQFLSDNAAAVHPHVWQALRDADSADTPYDTDALSGRLDEAFSELFGREVAALWVATGTAANCLALAEDQLWISQAGADALKAADRERLAGAGFSIKAVELDELEKAGGSLRCCIAEIY